MIDSDQTNCKLLLQSFKDSIIEWETYSCSLFEQTDKDADRCITFHELEKLIAEIQSGKTQVEKSYAISEMLKTFDLDKDGRIEEHEFIEGCSKWIDEGTRLAEKGDSETADFLREASPYLDSLQKNTLNLIL